MSYLSQCAHAGYISEGLKNCLNFYCRRKAAPRFHWICCRPCSIGTHAKADISWCIWCQTGFYRLRIEILQRLARETGSPERRPPFVSEWKRAVLYRLASVNYSTFAHACLPEIVTINYNCTLTYTLHSLKNSWKHFALHSLVFPLRSLIFPNFYSCF